MAALQGASDLSVLPIVVRRAHSAGLNFNQSHQVFAFGASRVHRRGAAVATLELYRKP
jgi:hypothetical protein